MSVHLLGLGVLLGGEPGDLLLQLLDALLQLILLAEPRRAPQFEQLALAGREPPARRDRLAWSASSLGTATRIGAVAFGGEPRLARIELGETLGDDRQIGAGHGFVEADENIAGLDPIAVVRAHFADDAAGRVLHLLHVGIDDERALGDERAGDFGGRGPAAEADARGTPPGRSRR